MKRCQNLGRVNNFRIVFTVPQVHKHIAVQGRWGLVGGEQLVGYL